MTNEPKRLPRHYWPITVVAMLAVMFIAAAVAVTLSVNPYVGMTASGGGFILVEVWQLRRRRY